MSYVLVALVAFTLGLFLPFFFTIREHILHYVYQKRRQRSYSKAKQLRGFTHE